VAQGYGLTVFRRLKGIYRKLDSAASLAAGVSQHDEQLAKLSAAVAELMNDPGLSPERREAAKKNLETLLLYQAQSRSETEQMRMLYESTAVRVAAVESEIAELKKKFEALEVSLNGKGPGGEKT
jgi:sugar (pentulose or hexulose) kinase